MDFNLDEMSVEELDELLKKIQAKLEQLQGEGEEREGEEGEAGEEPVEGLDELNRRLYPEEYEAVVDHLMDLGMEDGFVQELSSSDEKYIPSFDLTGVERDKTRTE